MRFAAPSPLLFLVAPQLFPTAANQTDQKSGNVGPGVIVDSGITTPGENDWYAMTYAGIQVMVSGRGGGAVWRGASLGPKLASPRALALSRLRAAWRSSATFAQHFNV